MLRSLTIMFLELTVSDFLQRNCPRSTAVSALPERISTAMLVSEQWLSSVDMRGHRPSYFDQAISLVDMQGGLKSHY